jgi:hypothetical protein
MKATWGDWALQFFPETFEEHQAMLTIMDGLKKLPNVWIERGIPGVSISPYFGDSQRVSLVHEVVEEPA